MRAERQKPAWAPRGVWALSFIGFLFLTETWLLLRQHRTFLGRYPLAVPGVFFDIPRLKRYVLPLVLVAGAAAIVAAVRRSSALVRRPRSAVLLVYVLGVALHGSMLFSLRDGPLAMEKRALSSGHGEYLVQTVMVDDLAGTLQDYERWVRPNLYLSNKGPGILVFFHSLARVANAEPIRPLLDGLGVVPNRSTIRWWLAEFWFDITGPPQAERLRYLVGLVFIVFPLITLLPVFLVYWVGRSFVSVGFGLLAAALYPLVPAVGLLVADLDYALYPLCALAVVAPFAVGVRQRRPVCVGISAVAFVAYFSMTMAALSLGAVMVVFWALTVLQRLARGEGPSRIAYDAARDASMFALVSLALLALLYVGAHFDPIERYTFARSIQQNWGMEYTGSWAAANLLGYFLSFGFAQTALLLVQQSRSALRVARSAGDPIDHLAIGWLCLLLALVVFGEQHGETNRLWAFLSPLACVIVARYIYDFVPSKLLWVPVVLFLAGLVVSRYQLSYF
jgi:hypothetical protein